MTKSKKKMQVISTDRFDRRREINNLARQVKSESGVTIKDYDQMDLFGKKLFNAGVSLEVDIDFGEARFDNASDRVKAWQAQYRQAKSPQLKEKIKNLIQNEVCIDYTPEVEYLMLRLSLETDPEIQERIKAQIYGLDRIIELPADLEAATSALLSNVTKH
jgi:hypothetical protein